MCNPSLLCEAQDFNSLEQIVTELCEKQARKYLRAHLENLDRKLMRERPRHLRSKGRRSRTIVTRVGPVEVERRLYLDLETGRHRYLLDEHVRLPARQRVSEGLRQEVVLLATRHSFRETARLGGDRVSHASVHTWTWQVGTACRREVERLRRSVFSLGRSLRGLGRQVGALFCEADGVLLRLQRETKRLVEAKLALVHEGWARLHPSSSEYRLKGKLAYAAIQSTGAFWESLAVLTGQRWSDLSAVKVIGGDGAEWVKKGLEVFPSAVYQLCRFHLARKIRECLNWSKRALGRVMVARRDPERLLYEASLAVLEAPGPEEETQAKTLVGYLAANADGLADYRDRVAVEDLELRGLGAIEGNIDKLISTRMCKRGMSWRKRGADLMLALLTHTANGWALPAVAVDEPPPERPTRPRRRSVRGGEPGGRSSHMPAIDTNRPLGKALRRLSLPTWPL